MFTYELIPGGVTIYKDGVPYIHQDRVPGVAGVVPMTEEQAREYAEAFIVANAPAVPDAEDAPVEA